MERCDPRDSIHLEGLVHFSSVLQEQSDDGGSSGTDSSNRRQRNEEMRRVQTAQRRDRIKTCCTRDEDKRVLLS
jgi:hypothetical protein